VTWIRRSSTCKNSRYPHRIWVIWVLASTHRHPQVLVSTNCKNCTKIYIILVQSYLKSSELIVATLLFFGRLPLSLNAAIISSRGTAPGRSHHEPRTEAAWVLSSDSECRILETVRPLREKALSTSVEVARRIFSNWQKEYPRALTRDGKEV